MAYSHSRPRYCHRPIGAKNRGLIPMRLLTT